MSTSYRNKSVEDFQSLDLDELDKISGGRSLTAAERADVEETAERCSKKKNKLIKQGRLSEAEALETNFFELYFKWVKEINETPLGSSEKLFSEVFEPYL